MLVWPVGVRRGLTFQRLLVALFNVGTRGLGSKLLTFRVRWLFRSLPSGSDRSQFWLFRSCRRSCASLNAICSSRTLVSLSLKALPPVAL